MINVGRDYYSVNQDLSIEFHAILDITILFNRYADTLNYRISLILD